MQKSPASKNIALYAAVEHVLRTAGQAISMAAIRRDAAVAAATTKSPQVNDVVRGLLTKAAVVEELVPGTNGQTQKAFRWVGEPTKKAIGRRTQQTTPAAQPVMRTAAPAPAKATPPTLELAIAPLVRDLAEQIAQVVANALTQAVSTALADAVKTAVTRDIAALTEQLRGEQSAFTAPIQQALAEHRPNRPVASKAKVVVIGLLPQQAGQIEQEFGQVFDLNFIEAGKNQRAKIRALVAQDPHIYAMVNFMSHALEKQIQGVTHYHRVAGGLTKLRDLLTQQYVDAEA